MRPKLQALTFFLKRGKTGQDSVELSRVRIAPNPPVRGVADFTGIGGSLRVESVADFVWNTH